MLLKKLTFFILLPTFLISCATSPDKIIISPFVPSFEEQNLTDVTLSLEVQDAREANFLAQFSETSKPEEIRTIGPRYSVKNVIENYLEDALEAQGATVNNSSINKLIVTINDLATIVEKESLVKTTATTNVKIRVDIRNDSSTFTKNFQSQKSSTHTSFPNVSDIELSLNQVINTAFTDAFYNQEMVTKLKEIGK